MASSPPAGAVRVLIADDDRLFAESLMAILSEDDRVDVVGVAEDGQQAVELAGELQPDVILMDLRMPVLDGLDATRRIRGSERPAQVLLMTGSDSPVEEEAAAAGAAAFLRKERGVDEVRDVFLEVASLAAVLGPAPRP